MKLPPAQFHLARGGTAPASRRALQRMAADVNNANSDLVNPTSGTPVGAHACRVYNPTPTSYADNTATDVTWGTESFDIDNWHDNVTNPGRITVDRAGIYLVEAAFLMPVIITGVSADEWLTKIILKKNGSAIGTFYGAGYDVFVSQTAMHTTLRLAAGDYLTLQFFQNSAHSAVVPSSGEYDCFFSVALLGTN